MPLSASDAEQIARDHFALTAAAPLHGELDANFLLTTRTGCTTPSKSPIPLAAMICLILKTR